MSIYFGVGESDIVDSFEAGKKAAKKALENAGITTCDFAFMFSTVGYDLKKLIEGVQSVLGKINITGCSGSGVITGIGPNEDLHCIGLMVIKSKDIFFKNSIGLGLKKDSYNAGYNVSKYLKKYVNDNSVLFAFPDSLSVNMKLFFDGLQKGFGKFVPVVGGISADNMKMCPELNYQFHDGELYHDSASCVLLYGNFSYEIGVSHGCVPLGLEKTVTSSKGNRIYTIDNIPSFEVIKEYADDNLSDLTFDLIVHLCYGEKLNKNLIGKYDNYIIRTPLTHDKRDGSVTIPAEISTGSKISLMRRDPEKIIKKIEELGSILNKKRKNENPLAVLHVNCAGRGKILMGKKVVDEYNYTKNIFKGDLPWIGFYSYGEIAPICNENYFHNYTSVIFAIYK